jgi:hypothetical protein
MIESKVQSRKTKRREEGETAMPHLLKLDSAKPEALYEEVLKEMDFPEGTEIEIEKHEDGVLLRPRQSTLQCPMSGREIVQQLEQALSKVRAGIPEDSPDLDSEWWIKTIKEGKLIKNLNIDLE